MEDSYICVRDENGDIIDPITCSVIPADRVIIVREGNSKWCMDAKALLKNILLCGNVSNPFTGHNLSDDVLAQIESYRSKVIDPDTDVWTW